MGRPKGSKNKQVEDIRSGEVLAAAKELSLEKVSNSLAGVQVEVQNTLAGLSSKLTQQLGVLRTVEDAINLKKEELRTLQSIEVTATTLDDLQASIEEERAKWADEQVAKIKEFDQRRAERDQVWKREEEQYVYDRNQLWKKAENDQLAKIAQIDKDAKNKQEMLEKGWAIREEELKSRESELITLRKQVADFPGQLKAEVDKAFSQATNQTKKEYETQAKILAAESATNQKLAEQQASSLNKTIADLQGQIISLKEQLTASQKDVKEISAKALEASAGREVIANLQKALENNQVRSGK